MRAQPWFLRIDFIAILNGSANPDSFGGTMDADTVRLLAGDDSIEAGLGNDLIYSGSGINLIFGGDGDDRIYGGDARDLIVSGSGSGADVLSGDAGHDRINGTSGNDSITGGPGADDFVYNTNDNGLDLIADFKPGEDNIQYGAIYLGIFAPPVGAINASQLHYGGPVGTNAQFVPSYSAASNTTLLLWYDQGPNTHGSTALLQLQGDVHLTTADIVIVWTWSLNRVSRLGARRLMGGFDPMPP